MKSKEMEEQIEIKVSPWGGGLLWWPLGASLPTQEVGGH